MSIPHDLQRQWYGFIVEHDGGSWLSEDRIAPIIAAEPGLFAHWYAQLKPADHTRVRVALAQDGVAERFSHPGGHELQ
jgi:hypothetical protein